MDFSDLLRRTNLNNIEDYFMNGGDSFMEPSVKICSERPKDAEKKITAFFEVRYTDIDGYDEITGYYYEHMEVYQDVFF